MKINTVLVLILLLMNSASQAEAPLYKPSSRSAEAIAISLNEYGASRIAPNALGIGELTPEFTLPVSGGGNYKLGESVAKGPVAIIFYRGHW